MIEILIVTGIVALIGTAVAMFGANSISFNRTIFNALTAAQNGRIILKQMSAEFREMSISNTGGFPIAEAGTSSIMFYTDTDNDGIKEQIRYYKVGSVLKRSIVKPTGNPLSYPSYTTGTTTDAVVAVSNTSAQSIFSYYDSSYTGIAGTELSQPVVPQSVRLIKVYISIDSDANTLPVPIVFTTQIAPRNLKDNL